MTIRTLDHDLATGSQRTDDPKTIGIINDLKIQLNDNRRKVLYGRYTLFAITGISLLTAGLLVASGETESGGLPGLLLTGAVYLVCGLISYRYLMGALIGGLGFYLLDHLTYLWIDPMLLLQGWALKAGIITALSLAIYAGFERRKLIRELSDKPVPSRELEEARRLRELPFTRHRPRKVS